MPEGESALAHPLLCHCLDVASVAGLFLSERLPPSLSTRLTSFHEEPDQSFRFLLYLIALHDLGKATPAFQRKVEWAEKSLPIHGLPILGAPSVHHSNTGFAFLREELMRLGMGPPEAAAYARCVAAHHGEFPRNEFLRPTRLGEDERGHGVRWDLARSRLTRALLSLFGPIDFAGVRAPTRGDVMMLSGLTSVADWLGSLQEVFRYESPWPSAEGYWLLALERAERASNWAGFRPPVPRTRRAFEELFAPFSPWPLHEEANSVASQLEGPALVVVEAPMGEGKTEAALVIADAAAAQLGQTGLFIGLPTRATANQMFERTKRFLEATHDGPATLLLAHGEANLVDSFGELRTSAIYDPTTGTRGGVRAEGWFASKKRALLGEHAVGTVDQALLAAMRVGHGFVRHFGLAGKTVVLDEVHAYDTYTGTLLDRLVEWLGAAGTSVVLLSATLPSVRRGALVEAYRRGAASHAGAAMEPVEATAVSYPRVTVATADGVDAKTVGQRRSPTEVRVEWMREDISALAVRITAEAQLGGCIAVICNTVARAQELYRVLDPQLGDHPRLLLHSRLFPAERLRRERQLELWLGPRSESRRRPNSCVVVGTQVLEQSLDVDFDLMFTDVAPVDLIFQRAGRLFRHERTRPSGREHPTLVLVSPGDDPVRADVAGLAAVYEPHFVRQTLLALDGREQLVIPTDIEPLVEQVYDPTILPTGHPLSGAQIEQLGKSCAQRADAETRLLPRVDVRDDFFGQLSAPFDEDDNPGRHSSTLAKTRDGPPSITLVCLDRDGTGLNAGTPAAPIRVDLSERPNRALVRSLVQRSVSVSRPSIVRALVENEAARPETWRDSALLRHRRLVIFENGETEVGGSLLRLDPTLGLIIGSAHELAGASPTVEDGPR